ncbi:MAG: YcgN family cysteine cluster protein [Alphaproteobacteria bacterium]|nr:YcgN family cysteine cluster protein [Alphaproteobacteria bacterium]
MTLDLQTADRAPFWRRKSLAEMSQAEWESLCDGCGKCCLHKLRCRDNTIAITNVACRLLDLDTCRCGDYPRRKRLVHDCVVLTPASVPTMDWLPQTCAYRLVAEGQDLPAWHPLKSGSADAVHRAGISVKDRAIGEREAGPLAKHVVSWPDF